MQTRLLFSVALNRNQMRMIILKILSKMIWSSFLCSIFVILTLSLLNLDISFANSIPPDQLAKCFHTVCKSNAVTRILYLNTLNEK